MCIRYIYVCYAHGERIRVEHEPCGFKSTCSGLFDVFLLPAKCDYCLHEEGDPEAFERAEKRKIEEEELVKKYRAEKEARKKAATEGQTPQAAIENRNPGITLGQDLIERIGLE
jgi:hypothetical protein